VIINRYIGPKVGFIFDPGDPRLPFMPAAQPRVLSLSFHCMCLVFDKIR
jgi:hypothetical protein